MGRDDERALAGPAVGGERAAGDGDVEALGCVGHARTVPAVKPCGAADDHEVTDAGRTITPLWAPAVSPPLARHRLAGCGRAGSRLRPAEAGGGEPPRTARPPPSPPRRPRRPPHRAARAAHLGRDRLRAARRRAHRGSSSAGGGPRWRRRGARAPWRRAAAGAARPPHHARRARPAAPRVRAARATLRRLSGARARRAGRRASATSTRSPASRPPDRRALRAGLPRPAPQPRVTGPPRGRAPAAGHRATLRARPRRVPVLPRPGHPAPAARQLGPRQRAARRCCLRSARCPFARRLRRALDAGWSPLGAAARPLPGLGVLLLLRRRHAAVDQRHDPGHGRAGARPRRDRARRPPLAGRRRARARRVPGAAAGRRRRRAPGRPPLPHVLVLARPADPQRRPAGDHGPARPRRPRRAAAPRASCTAAASAPPGARSRASTPAPGRCTPTAAASRRSATTSSSATFLGNLCERTDGRDVLRRRSTASRATRREPPRIRLAPPARLHAERATACASRSRSSRPSRPRDGPATGSTLSRRLALTARRPHRRLDPAGARPLPRADRRQGPERPARRARETSASCCAKRAAEARRKTHRAAGLSRRPSRGSPRCGRRPRSGGDRRGRARRRRRRTRRGPRRTPRPRRRRRPRSPSSVWKSTSVWSEPASETQCTFAVACPSARSSGRQLVELGHVVPVEVGLVGRELLDHLADAAQLAPAQPRVGVRLQRALGDRGAVALRARSSRGSPRRARRGSGAATLPCFIESTTSFSSAWLRPSTSRL